MKAFAKSERSHGEVVQHLKRKLEDPSPEARKWAAKSLRALVPDEAEPLLLRTTEDADRSVRACAALCLCGYNSPATLSRMETLLLSDPDEDVRQAAATALAFSKRETAGYVLLRALCEDSSEKVRRAATHAIIYCPESAFPVLQQIICSPSEPYTLRLQAARITMAVAYFEKRHDWAAILIRQAPELALEALLELCRHTQPGERALTYKRLRHMLQNYGLDHLIERVNQAEKEDRWGGGRSL